jgi:uncharacterized protein YcaQ
MASSGTWKESTREYLDRERPGLISAVEAAVKESGPLTAADLEHLAPTERRGGSSWWNTGDVNRAFDYLFITGRIAVSSRPHFQRRYDDPVRVWGRDPRDGALRADDARQTLFDHSLLATGIGTPRDVADHFRLPPKEAHHRALSAVERGRATWIEVESWGEPALLSAMAADPGRATGAALLSPFDPICWNRDRLLRMFGTHYRIEIYTPAHKREFGYYCLPFLIGDQIVGRVDLKADRQAKTLVVQSAWREEGTIRGAKRRRDDDVAAALATELRLTASWLGLEQITVAPRGTLSLALGAATRSSSP